MTTTEHAMTREQLWRLLTDAILESPPTVSQEEAENIADDMLDTPSGKRLIAALEDEDDWMDGSGERIIDVNTGGYVDEQD